MILFSKAKKISKKIFSCQIMGYFALAFLAWYISNNWYQLAMIQGNSMNPTYKNGAIILLDKRTDEFSIGDIVAFYNEGLDLVLIKRIVGLPGDTIQVVDGFLYVNEELSNYQRQEDKIDYAGTLESPVLLKNNEYFVLGDNYVESKDSRYEEIGCVLKEQIIGKAL